MKDEKPDPTINVLHIVELTKQHILDIMALHVSYQKDLREAEAKRIDAIRSVDVAAVVAANDKAIQQANVLAAQLVTTANSINERLTKVESEQYKKQGSGSGMENMWLKIMGAALLALTIYSTFKK